MAYKYETPARRALFDTACNGNTPVSKRIPHTFESPFSIRSLLNLGDETASQSTQAAEEASSGNIMSSLASVPAFAELTKTLTTDINTQAMPSQLIQTVSPQLIPVPNCISALEERIYSLKDQMHDQTKLLELETFFHEQAHQVECERYTHLSNCLPMHQHAINIQCDHQLRLLIGRVERSIRLLETSIITRDNISDNLAVFETRNSLENCDLPPQPIMTSTPKKNTEKTRKPRSRAVYSRQAKDLLETWYAVNSHSPYPSSDVITSLANQTELTTSQVRKWFSNKRLRGGRVNKNLVRHLYQHNELLPISSVQSWM
ncbi:unnamed protein product [Owenia fusiformis]|uniref:Uncharacterized protein n=1 Tax=Owenia fusiformis TaxID=6347 RepID=A0A8J1YB92_OWEFU|nr:unnamed protein product [Owenia fusiformis]